MVEPSDMHRDMHRDPDRANESNGDDLSPEFLRLLEATVLAAGKYVVPSDDLRPHTLEAAKEVDSDRKGTFLFFKVAAVIAVCVGLCWPVADRLSPWRERISGRSALQIEEMALKKNMGPDWGLFELFQERQQKSVRHRQGPPQWIEE